MQDGPNAVWSILYISVASFFPILKQNFIAYRSSKVSWRPDCIFEIHQLWQSGFSRMYSNSCCRCSFEAEIIRIGQSSHKMYSNNIVNFQESTSILNVRTKMSGILLNAPCNWSCWCCAATRRDLIPLLKENKSFPFVAMSRSSCLRFRQCVSWNIHTVVFLPSYWCLFMLLLSVLFLVTVISISLCSLRVFVLMHGR